MITQKLTKDTCIHKLESLSNKYDTEQQEKCLFNCNQNTCLNYKAVGYTLPIKKGYYALRNFYINKISIRGLPHETEIKT